MGSLPGLAVHSARSVEIAHAKPNQVAAQLSRVRSWR